MINAINIWTNLWKRVLFYGNKPHLLIYRGDRNGHSEKQPVCGRSTLEPEVRRQLAGCGIF